MDGSNNWIQIRNAHTNNLKNIDVDVPKRSTVGTATELATSHPEAIVIDQQPIGRTSRGNIASYIGIFNHIRKLFSDASGQVSVSDTRHGHLYGLF